jgi:thioredoxin-dependent peroxiredoxin
VWSVIGNQLFGYRGLVKIGQLAPNFSGLSDEGHSIALGDFRGQWLVLYFYAKAGTTGCSIEAQHFEHHLHEFKAINTAVLGISTDAASAQAKFRDGCQLSFPMIADIDKAIAKTYGTFAGLQALFGTSSHQTFLIDPNGVLVHHWRFVNPFSHVGDVLETLKSKQILVT